MQKLEHIEVGQEADDGKGDLLRIGMIKVNANFAAVEAGVQVLEQSVAAVSEVATSASAVAQRAIPKSEKGMPNGVTPLDASGKVPATHLPELNDYIPVDQIGAPGGVAPLDQAGKVPVAHLPTGTAGGIAPLDDQGKVPAANLPPEVEAIPLTEKGAAGGVAPLGADSKVPVANLPIGTVGGVPQLDGTRRVQPKNSSYPEVITPGGGVDINHAYESEDYHITSPADNVPPGWVGDSGLLRVRGLPNFEVVQEFFDIDVQSALWWRVRASADDWGPWRQVVDTSMGAKSVVLQPSDTVDANALTEPETIYKWINQGPNWTNFPNSKDAGYMRVYALGVSTIAQELTIHVTGRKPYCFSRFGVPGQAWQPWRVTSAYSNNYTMPDWDAGDVYVDGIGWHRWDGSKYVVSGNGTMGPGQSLVDVTASRALGVQYTNSTGRPIVVYVRGYATTDGDGFYFYLNLDNQIVDIYRSTASSKARKYAAISATIPAGLSYVIYASGITIDLWREYR